MDEQKILKYIECMGWGGYFWDIIKNALKRQVPTGHWIAHNADNPFIIYGECSKCGFEQSMSAYLKYCPECGQAMNIERGISDEQ